MSVSCFVKLFSFLKDKKNIENRRTRFQITVTELMGLVFSLFGTWKNDGVSSQN